MILRKWSRFRVSSSVVASISSLSWSILLAFSQIYTSRMCCCRRSPLFSARRDCSSQERLPVYPYLKIIGNDKASIDLMTQHSVIYEIAGHDGHYHPELKTDDTLIHKGNSFYRRAVKGPLSPNWDQKGPFVDVNFPIIFPNSGANPSQNYSTKHLYNFYNKEIEIFDPAFCQQGFIERKASYPSFITELGAIDKDYLKTLFITQRVSPLGYIEYFVKRNGVYHVEFIDDLIPVQGPNQLPLWGLSSKEPWKLILAKAWLKEKLGINGLEAAEPFSFLQAFGMPAYRVMSIEKELSFLQVSQMAPKKKSDKQESISIFRPHCINIAKTRNSTKVEEYGLPKDRAGFVIYSYEDKRSSNLIEASHVPHKQEPLFKVKGSIETPWLGSYAVGSSKMIQTEYNPSLHKMNLEKEFLTDYTELTSVFNRFYTAVEGKTLLSSGKFVQDHIKVKNNNAARVFLIEVAGNGYFNINVELPKQTRRVLQSGKVRYAPIKFFLANVNVDKTAKDKHDFAKLTHEQIDYVRGYHHSSCTFRELKTGTYYAYVYVDTKMGEGVDSYVVSINTSADLKVFQQITLSPAVMNKFVRKFFGSYSKESGNRFFINQGKGLDIFFDNCFEYLGFGYVTIRNDRENKTVLAMKVDPAVLENSAIIIEYDLPEKVEEGKRLYKVKPGEETTIVFDAIKRKKIQKDIFPPQGSIEFYEIFS